MGGAGDDLRLCPVPLSGPHLPPRPAFAGRVGSPRGVHRGLRRAVPVDDPLHARVRGRVPGGRAGLAIVLVQIALQSTFTCAVQRGSWRARREAAAASGLGAFVPVAIGMLIGLMVGGSVFRLGVAAGVDGLGRDGLPAVHGRVRAGAAGVRVADHDPDFRRPFGTGRRRRAGRSCGYSGWRWGSRCRCSGSGSWSGGRSGWRRGCWSCWRRGRCCRGRGPDVRPACPPEGIREGSHVWSERSERNPSSAHDRWARHEGSREALGASLVPSGRRTTPPAHHGLRGAAPRSTRGYPRGSLRTELACPSLRSGHPRHRDDAARPPRRRAPSGLALVAGSLAESLAERRIVRERVARDDDRVALHHRQRRAFEGAGHERTTTVVLTPAEHLEQVE